VLKQPALDDEPDHPHRYPFAHGWLHWLYRKQDLHNPLLRGTIKTVSVEISIREMLVAATGCGRHTTLTYVTWNHPNMPLDATEVHVMPISAVLYYKGCRWWERVDHATAFSSLNEWEYSLSLWLVRYFNRASFHAY
jgi:hypothetical protein